MFEVDLVVACRTLDRLGLRLWRSALSPALLSPNDPSHAKPSNSVFLGPGGAAK